MSRQVKYEVISAFREKGRYDLSFKLKNRSRLSVEMKKRHWKDLGMVLEVEIKDNHYNIILEANYMWGGSGSALVETFNELLNDIDARVSSEISSEVYENVSKIVFCYS